MPIPMHVSDLPWDWKDVSPSEDAEEDVFLCIFRAGVKMPSEEVLPSDELELEAVDPVDVDEADRATLELAGPAHASEDETYVSVVDTEVDVDEKDCAETDEVMEVTVDSRVCSGAGQCCRI